MSAANNAVSLGLQLEKVRPELARLFQLDQTLFTRIMARPKDTVSTRPERIDFLALSGGKARVFDPDGGDMGRGSGPVNAVGTLSPVYFDYVMEWTKLAEIATDNKEKAIASYAKQILKNGMDQFKSNLDSLISYGDGANTLGVVTAYDSTNHIITVDNANRFYDGQDIDVYNGGLGTSLTATATILSVDGNNKQLYLTGAPSANPTAGALLLQNNSAGTAGTGINGITSLQVNSNTGTYMGVTRANYPGKFSTPTVTASGALTPALARLLLNQLKIARGVDIKPSDGSIFFMGLDQQAAWENTGTVITQIIQSGGEATARDTLAAKQVSTIAGIEIVPSLKAIPGRIDLISLKDWFRQEIQPLDYYEAGGQTVFPPYAGSGGIAAAYMTYLVWGGNIGNQNPRAGAYVTGLTVPSGY